MECADCIERVFYCQGAPSPLGVTAYRFLRRYGFLSERGRKPDRMEIARMHGASANLCPPIRDQIGCVRTPTLVRLLGSNTNGNLGKFCGGRMRHVWNHELDFRAT